ncbi:MAG: hypothetical protein AAGD11_04325 [Planctomycetota bacterium]
MSPSHAEQLGSDMTTSDVWHPHSLLAEHAAVGSTSVSHGAGQGVGQLFVHFARHERRLSSRRASAQSTAKLETSIATNAY